MTDDIIKQLQNTSLPTKNNLISRDRIKKLLHEIQAVLFPGYFEALTNDLETYLEYKLNDIQNMLQTEIKAAFLMVDNKQNHLEIVKQFMSKIPAIKASLLMDMDAIFNGDPASASYDEIILCYPGFLAITVYRIAHELYLCKVPFIPRILTEMAHSKTGIDIHPGATIGKYFFIDHGTGIVVGETTIIGDNVKIYQGVTIGALSLKEGHALSGTKRHPTIMDNVTIYAGASILGGETIIGEGCTIGSNVFITHSIPEGKMITLKLQETKRIV